MGIKIKPIYTPITEKEYCCVPAVLQMIFKRRGLRRPSQEEIGWELGLTVPKEKAHLFKKVRSINRIPKFGWGTKTYKKEYSINNYFLKKNLPLICNLYNLQNIRDISKFIIHHLQTNHDIIVYYNSQILFNHGDKEHVSLIQEIDRNIITLIDPAIGVPKIRRVKLPKLLRALIPQRAFWIISGKAIIFDMDGLMVDSEPLHFRASDILLKEYGFGFDNLPASLKSGFMGKRVIDFIKAVIEYLNLDVELDKFYQKRMEIFLNLVKEKLQPTSGLFKSLNLLKKNNFKIGLATSGTKQYIEIVLKKFKIRNYFDAIVAGDDVKIGKPNPETYLVASKKLDFAPEECIVLEDTTNGIESAKKAGCECIAVKNLYVPQDCSRADLRLNSLKELTLDIIFSLIVK